MKREDLLVKGYTEEQVDEILGIYHQNDKKVKELEKQIEQDNAFKVKAQELEKQLNDINEANLSEQEKLAKKEAEIETRLSNARKIENTAKAREILAGYDVDDELISRLVSDNIDDTINMANLFKSKIDTVKTSVANETREKLANADVKPTPTNISQDDGIMTLEKLKAMTMTEQLIFKRENPDIYAEITNK